MSLASRSLFSRRRIRAHRTRTYRVRLPRAGADAARQPHRPAARPPPGHHRRPDPAPALPHRLPRRPRPGRGVPAAGARRAPRPAPRPRWPRSPRRWRPTSSTDEPLSRWMSSVNDLRLVIGTHLDVTEDDGRHRGRRPRRSCLAVYGYLAFLSTRSWTPWPAGSRSRRTTRAERPRPVDLRPVAALLVSRPYPHGVRAPIV